MPAPVLGRVILVNQYYPPDEAATAQLLGDLGSALAASGFAVRTICGDRGYADPSKRYPARATIDAVAVERVRSTSFGRTSKLGRVLDYGTFLIGAAFRLLVGPRPDVVISLTTPPLIALVGSCMARIRGARSIFWSMDVYPDVAYELGALRRTSFAGRFFGWLSRRMLRSADIVVALGETMRERLIASGAERVKIIPNWSPDFGSDDEPAAANRLRREWGWEGRFVVMYSGNLGLAHEFNTLLQAALSFSERNSRVLFAFVGSGPRLDEVKLAARELALKNVEFRSPVPREMLGETLRAADVHVVTLRDRMPGLLVPSKIYGILSAARPAIYVGPDQGELWDIVREGACGSCAQIGDVARLVQIIEDYLQSVERTRQQGARAREMYLQRFTPAKSIAMFVDLLAHKAVDHNQVSQHRKG